MQTTSRFEFSRPHWQRRNWRPMRPKPLMPTLIFFICDASLYALVRCCKTHVSEAATRILRCRIECGRDQACHRPLRQQIWLRQGLSSHERARVAPSVQLAAVTWLLRTRARAERQPCVNLRHLASGISCDGVSTNHAATVHYRRELPLLHAATKTLVQRPDSRRRAAAPTIRTQTTASVRIAPVARPSGGRRLNGPVCIGTVSSWPAVGL